MVVGGIVVFGLGVLVGFLLGRSDEPETFVAGESPEPSIALSPTSGPVLGGSPAVETPEPGQEPAITNQGQVLIEGDRSVVAAPTTVPCQTLVTPGSLGECGEVLVAGARVVWVVERSVTTTGATALRARVFTFVPDAGGWVEWLAASDPAGGRWSDVNVLPADLTGDGVPELVVGFRGADERATLEYDIVGYGESGVPSVIAHPQAAARGVVVVSGGQIQEYGAQYPNDEAACCPPSYLHRTIGYDAGFLRLLASESVTPNVVPSSQV